MTDSDWDDEIEKDIVELLKLMARSAGGSYRAGERFAWTLNPLAPSRSRVFAIRLGSVSESQDLAAQASRGEIPTRLMIGRSARPANLEEALPGLGFTRINRQTGMWLEFEAGSGLVRPEPDPRVRRIEDGNSLAEWVRAANAGFGRDEGAELYQRLLGEGTLRFYGLCEGGRVVATLLAFARGDIVGLHTIATPPEFRGKGYATAITAHALAIAAAEGRTAVVLQASDLGAPVYARLGFRRGAELRHWEYRP